MTGVVLHRARDSEPWPSSTIVKYSGLWQQLPGKDSTGKDSTGKDSTSVLQQFGQRIRAGSKANGQASFTDKARRKIEQ